MSALAPVKPQGELARVEMIRGALAKLSEASGDTLREAIRDLPKFAKVLDALIGADEHWQAEFRRSVVIALQRLPATASDVVPWKLGLRVLHSVIHSDGPRPAIELISTGTPSWTELIRAYRPDYARGNVETLADHVERAAATRAVDPIRTATRSGKDRMRVGALRALVRTRTDRLARSLELLGRCEDAGMTDNQLVPLEWL